MAQHRFKVGDLVRIQSGASANQDEAFLDAIAHKRPAGVFEVMAQLPEAAGEAQYRLRGGDDRKERVVRESQLIAAVTPAQSRP